MNPEYKIQVCLDLVDQLTDLIEGNEYQQFFVQHLIPIRVELERQLTTISNQSTIEE